MSAIADPHWPGAAVALQMIQGALRQLGAAVMTGGYNLVDGRYTAV